MPAKYVHLRISEEMLADMERMKAAGFPDEVRADQFGKSSLIAIALAQTADMMESRRDARMRRRMAILAEERAREQARVEAGQTQEETDQ